MDIKVDLTAVLMMMVNRLKENLDGHMGDLTALRSSVRSGLENANARLEEYPEDEDDFKPEQKRSYKTLVAYKEWLEKTDEMYRDILDSYDQVKEENEKFESRLKEIL